MFLREIDYIEHYGVRGMRWGVRKDTGSSNTTSGSSSTTSKKRKAAVILGSAAAVAAIAAGAYYAQKHYGTSISDADVSDIGKQFAKAFAEEPVGIVHGARGKNKGFTFPARGGLEDPVVEYEKAGFNNFSTQSMFRRYGKNNEKVAARFDDPEGRRDFAGRPIFHEVVLPEELARDVSSVDDVTRKVWPLIKDTYDALYRS